MKIIPALPADADQLSIITKRSKALWGYSAEQMQAWDAELTISPEAIRKNITFKLLEAGQTLAYYQLHPPEANDIYLENLFVLPGQVGKGYGRILLEHAFVWSRTLKCHSMSLHADPHATNFYLKFGFELIGRKPTSIPGRYLPHMRRLL